MDQLISFILSLYFSFQTQSVSNALQSLLHYAHIIIFDSMLLTWGEGFIYSIYVIIDLYINFGSVMFYKVEIENS